MKHSQNKPRRREPYHYDASGAQYIACIETALQHGQSIPVHVLQLVYICCCRICTTKPLTTLNNRRHR